MKVPVLLLRDAWGGWEAFATSPGAQLDVSSSSQEREGSTALLLWGQPGDSWKLKTESVSVQCLHICSVRTAILGRDKTRRGGRRLSYCLGTEQGRGMQWGRNTRRSAL